MSFPKEGAIYYFDIFIYFKRVQQIFRKFSATAANVSTWGSLQYFYLPKGALQNALKSPFCTGDIKSNVPVALNNSRNESDSNFKRMRTTTRTFHINNSMIQSQIKQGVTHVHVAAVICLFVQPITEL